MAGLASGSVSKRLPSRAALMSVALHSGLLAALLCIREDLPQVGRADVVHALWLRLDGSGTSLDPPASPVTAPEQAAAAESTPLAAPEAVNGETPAAETAVATTLDVDADGPPDVATEPTAPMRAAPANEAEPARALDRVASTEPTTEPPTKPATALAAEPASRKVQTLPMRAEQQKMLSRRFASLTRSFAADEPPRSVSWKSDGQVYTAEFDREPSSDPMGTDHVVIEVSTVDGGTRLSTKLRMRRLAFSDFAQFVDRWDPDMRLHDDEIDGRFHSNAPIHVQSGHGATPVFRGRVTTASREVDIDSRHYTSRHKVFPNGIETGVRRIALPERFVPFEAGAEPGEDQIERLTRDARVTFFADGTYVVNYVDDATQTAIRRPLAEPAAYILAAEDANVYVSGVVNGKVLVYSPAKIIVEHDLVYATSPEEEGADDYLGLVSDRAVEIAAPDVTGPGDLEIDAAIYARRRFAVRKFLSRPSGTLIIRGAVAAGSLSATEPRYATRVVFDRRLEHVRAPRFPLTDRYELEPWNGEWTTDSRVAAQTTAN